MSTSIKDQYSESDLKKLKEDCGYGYAVKIQSELKRKSGRNYSTTHIYKGLSPKYKSENVIEAAISVAKKRREEMEQATNYKNHRT